jgi:hypothetical protein
VAIRRLPNWQIQLNGILTSAAELSFEWGKFDCALHAANCVRAITGADPAAGYRGLYSDEASAIALFGSDLGNFAAGILNSLGFPEVPVTFARRGDVVLVDNSTSYGALGVVSLDPRYVSCASDKGLVLVAMPRWKRAWRVG